MIELIQFPPRFGGVACLATHGFAVFPNLRHPLLELPVMYIFVATGAGKIVEVIRSLCFWLVLVRELVAITARHSNVPTSQFEFCLLVLCQSEGRRTIPLQVVALITLVLVGLSCELVVVLVLMTISAAFEARDLEDRVLALGGMALVTCDLCVTLEQGIVGLGVRLNVEERRFPAVHIVAGGTFDAFRPLGKLSLVLILVAVGTFCECQFLLKVSVCMT